MCLAIVYMLHGRARITVDRLRRKYDPLSASRIPGHLTILGPSDGNETESELQTARESMGRVAEGHQPLPIRLRGPRTFLPASNTTYFSIEPATRVGELHGAFARELRWPEAFPTFIPHVTITEYLSSKDMKEVLDDLPQLQFDDVISQVQLVQRREDNIWLDVGSAPLGGSSRNL